MSKMLSALWLSIDIIIMTGVLFLLIFAQQQFSTYSTNTVKNEEFNHDSYTQSTIMSYEGITIRSKELLDFYRVYVTKGEIPNPSVRIMRKDLKENIYMPIKNESVLKSYLDARYVYKITYTFDSSNTGYPKYINIERGTP